MYIHIYIYIHIKKRMYQYPILRRVTQVAMTCANVAAVVGILCARFYLHG